MTAILQGQMQLGNLLNDNEYSLSKLHMKWKNKFV